MKTVRTHVETDYPQLSQYHGREFRVTCLIWEDPPPPCNSGIIGIYEDPNDNQVKFIPYSQYGWAGGPPNAWHR